MVKAVKHLSTICIHLPVYAEQLFSYTVKKVKTKIALQSDIYTDRHISSLLQLCGLASFLFILSPKCPTSKITFEDLNMICTCV